MFLKIIKLNCNEGIIHPIKIFIKRITNNCKERNNIYFKQFINKSGIEIGGPSTLFKDKINIYKFAKSIDGVNFSSRTIWEGEIAEGLNYKVGVNKKGYQYISDAVDLSKIESGKYDFVISSNCLEHIANPLKALKEWLRILKGNGLLLLVLPNKSSNFDHKRRVTQFDHLLEDLNNNVSERDLTHLDEILSLHDLPLDRAAGDYENFRNRSLENFKNRCLHHHVYDINLLLRTFEYLNIEVLSYQENFSDYIILGKKPNR